MEFDDLVREVQPIDPVDLVGIAIFYRDQIQEFTPVTTEKIRELINKCRIDSIPPKAYGPYIRSLKNDSLIENYQNGYRLTHNGIEYYREKVENRPCTREEKFISVNNDADFYNSLIEDINLSFQYGIDDGTLVLSRKLIENLLIDILRTRYGFDENNIDIFYNRDERRFNSFSHLISNFENNLDDFEFYSERVDEGIIDKLNSIREQGNAGAHSIEVNPTEAEIENFRTRVNEVAEVLFMVREELRRSEGNQA